MYQVSYRRKSNTPALAEKPQERTIVMVRECHPTMSSTAINIYVDKIVNRKAASEPVRQTIEVRNAVSHLPCAR